MWVIITRDQCNFCDQAKALLKASNLPYTEYNVLSPSSKWLLYLLKRTSITTVPQIFKPDGTYIGGFKELQEHLVNG